MSFKFSWTNKKDGDDIYAEHVNSLADGIIETQEAVKEIDTTTSIADNQLEKRIDNIKYYGDADANPTPDDWFTFSDEAHTILLGLSDGHRDAVEVTIPNTVTTINDGAFSGCSSLTSVTIPNSVTYIGDGAFHNCNSLTNITIPNGVKTIYNGTFSSCSSLTNVTIPNGVTSIGNGAFSGCINLTSITIPNTVTTINGGTFNGCESLTSITIPNSVKSIDAGAFENTGNLTIYCSQYSYADTFAQTNRIPVKYTEVIDGLGGFWGLDLPLIKTITLQESVTSIDILSKAEGIKLQEFTVLLFIKYLGDAIESNSISNCVMCLRTDGGGNYFGYKGGYNFYKEWNSFAFWHTKIYDNKFALTDLYSGYGDKYDIPYQGFQGIMRSTPTQYSSYTSFGFGLDAADNAVDNLNVFISNGDVPKGAIIPQGSMVFLLGR